MKIQVRLKTVYGNEMIYPVCEKAKIFAQMVGQTTLTRRDVHYIKALGFEVEVIQEAVKL